MIFVCYFLSYRNYYNFSFEFYLLGCIYVQLGMEDKVRLNFFLIFNIFNNGSLREISRKDMDNISDVGGILDRQCLEFIRK